MSNSMKTTLFAFAALIILLMGVSIQKVWQKYKAHQMIILDAGGIPPGSVWGGWVQDAYTSEVNFCYSSGSRYEEYLMVRVMTKQYPTVRRNLKTNFHLAQPIEFHQPENKDVLQAIQNWWNVVILETLLCYAPQTGQGIQDRILFDDTHNIIYFYAVRPGDFKKN